MTDRQALDKTEAMAAGLALGLLEGNERAEALRLQLGDPHFAQLVRVWQQVGDRWLEEIDPIAAPANTLDRIEAELDRNTPGSGDAHPSNDSGTARFWRGWALTATAASLVLTMGLGLTAIERSSGKPEARADKPASNSVQRASNVIQIDDSEGLPLVSALYEPTSGNLSLRLADFREPGLSPELWVIPADGVPRSLGMLVEDSLTISISPKLRAYLQDGAAMAITLEPNDGEQHEAPTGEILGTAVLQEVPAAQT